MSILLHVTQIMRRRQVPAFKRGVYDNLHPLFILLKPQNVNMALFAVRFVSDPSSTLALKQQAAVAAGYAVHFPSPYLVDVPGIEPGCTRRKQMPNRYTPETRTISRNLAGRAGGQPASPVCLLFRRPSPKLRNTFAKF